MHICEDNITYTKSTPSEIIELNDVIMVDPETQRVTRSVLNKPSEMQINSRFTIGICIKSDNEFPLNEVIDGGDAKNIERIVLSGGDSNHLINEVIDGGDANINPRNLIDINYIGNQEVNTEGDSNINIGDKLCISNTPGKLQSRDLLQIVYQDEIRSLGKVISIDENTNKALVLLNIE